MPQIGCSSDRKADRRPIAPARQRGNRYRDARPEAPRVAAHSLARINCGTTVVVVVEDDVGGALDPPRIDPTGVSSGRHDRAKSPRRPIAREATLRNK
jgi:hypothetical protein